MKFLLVITCISSVLCYGQNSTPPLIKPVETQSEIIDKDAFVIVETDPEFPGGMEKLMRFISDNFKYPQIDQDNRIEGRIYVSFIVEKDGSVSTVGIMSSVSATLDAEAIRVVKLLPKWKPGTLNGKPIRVNFNLPILVKLKEEY